MSNKYWMTKERDLEESDRYGNEIYPSDIVEVLMNLADDGEDGTFFPDDKEKDEIIDVVYNLHAICENPYNRNGYRMLYKLLATVAEVAPRNMKEVY